MQVGLKIWRYDSTTGDRALQRVRGRRARGGDAARLPRHRQGPARRHARLPEELPDDDLRLLRDADGRRRRARLQGADVRHREGRPRAGDLGDGEPARSSRTSSSTWIRSGRSSGRSSRSSSPATTSRRGRQGARDLAGADERDPQGVALHQLRLLRLRVQLDGVGPRVPRPAALAKGMRFVGDPRDAAKIERLDAVLRPSTGSGTAPAATSATSAAPRASTRATRSRSSAPRR